MAKKTKGTKRLSLYRTNEFEWILKNIPFVLFIVFLMIAYIANAHYSEKKIREIQGLQREVKDLRWEYMSLKSSLMYSTKQSEVVKAVELLGLKPMKGKPKKIKIKKPE